MFDENRDSNSLNIADIEFAALVGGGWWWHAACRVNFVSNPHQVVVEMGF